MRRPGPARKAGRRLLRPGLIAIALIVSVALGEAGGSRRIGARGPDVLLRPEPGRLETPWPEPKRLRAPGYGGPLRAWQAVRPYAWQRLSSPAGVRYAARGSDGRVWLRALSDTEDWLQVYAPDGRRLLSLSSQALIEARWREIQAAGSLAEFWTVDSQNRIWLGPRYFDGAGWRSLAQNRSGQGFRLTWSAVSGLDADGGTVWVPFRSERDCAEQGTCVDSGLQAFDSEGALEGRAIALASVPEADALGLREVYLPAGLERASVAVALGRSQLHQLSARPNAFDHPFLGPPDEPGGLRNAGFLSTATQRPDGAPQAILWIEEQLREGLTWRTVTADWNDGAEAWGLVEDLSAGPLTAADPAHLRLVAADWRPEADGYWCASSEGSVAFHRTEGGWESTFDRDAIGLPARARILDLAAGAEGRLWLVSDAGIWYFGPVPDRFTLRLPLLLRGR